ncbi:G-type lectin S-receptor-like serine/threonine-protein kinase SD2-5 [Nicotiana tomentosiformis]|uniref:G-type lectin S-receptor-like serine/threonine-protein kinase SD2-5 n=1 Tax=Nicotiana tomentosiformis TaxID=4098 RepID=UPI00388CE96A
MIAEWRLNIPVILFVYLIFSSSQFAISKQSWNINVSLWNSTARVPTFWINNPYVNRNYSTTDFSAITPILLSGKDSGSQFLCGFVCNYEVTGCLLGTLLVLYNSTAIEKKYTILYPQLVWSANRNHPVKANATLQLGRDGNLVLADSDGTLVWSTNTTGKPVSGLNLTEMGNLVLFDKRNRAIWQSFDHPTDSLLSGQDLVSGQKLIASISASNRSQGFFSLTILNGSLVAYTDTNPPQYYYASDYTNDTGLSFDGHTLSLASTFAQFMKLEHNGHLRLYQFDIYELDWKVISDVWTSESDVGNCGYPMVCGRYSICTSDGQCNCPYEGNFFRPSIGRKTDLGCTALTPITCDSLQYHSLLELSDTRYFAFDVNFQLNSSIWFEGIKLEDCKTACLSNCSCKAVVWDGTRRKNCLLLNEVFSIMDNGEGRDKTTVFLKVQNQSPIISGGKQSRPVKVILGSTLAALVGIILSITTWFILFKKRSQSSKVGDFLDIEPLLPGILTRFSYNELKILTEDFSKKLGEGGFGSVYEGTLSNGTKIAVKHLDDLGQVKDSFLTEVNIVGGIHHVNLVKLIGFCAEKSDRLLIYEYMVNGSLDRWISHEKKENRLTWKTRQSIISDIAKGLAYLHEDCSHKIIHLDIKPQNILLDQYFNAKISDFGLSKLIEKDKSKVLTRMRGTPGYLAPEWLSSVITEKVDVYAFGIVLLEILCGRKNLDWSQADEEDVHLLSVFRRKVEQQQLTDMVDKNDEDMLLHKEAVTEMMSIAAWCLQGDFSKRPSMSLVVKVLEGLVTVETDLDYNFTNIPEVREGNQQREATISSRFPSVLSGPRIGNLGSAYSVKVTYVHKRRGAISLYQQEYKRKYKIRVNTLINPKYPKRMTSQDHSKERVHTSASQHSTLIQTLLIKE